MLCVVCRVWCGAVWCSVVWCGLFARACQRIVWKRPVRSVYATQPHVSFTRRKQSVSEKNANKSWRLEGKNYLGRCANLLRTLPIYTTNLDKCAREKESENQLPTTFAFTAIRFVIPTEHRAPNLGRCMCLPIITFASLRQKWQVQTPSKGGYAARVFYFVWRQRVDATANITNEDNC